MPHTAGLPVAENTICQVYSYPDRIEINANGTQFNLSKDRITDIATATDVEIQKQYVSSAAGAVGGALLFGAVGALIGGRVKEKRIETVRSYLIFSYEKDGSISHIAFDATGAFFAANKFVNEYNSTASSKVMQVNL
jgi:hypothetical protein